MDPNDGGHDAAEFLRGLLSDGEKAARWIFSEANAAGYSRDTMHRAKRKIGVTVRKVSMTEGWAWSLPGGSGEGREDSAQNCPRCSPSSTGTLPSSCTVAVDEL